MEKIALIMDPGTRNMVINQKTIDRLSGIGEVVMNEGGNNIESVKPLLEGATVCVTSWGSTPLDEELLAVCPDLKILIHAAGSVKPVVSDALWEKGVRVASSAPMLSMGVSETALGFTISASKNFYNLNANLHNGLWKEGKENIRELYELTVGVISGGWAGRHYIELLAPFNVDILLYDPFISDETAASWGCRKASFEEVLELNRVDLQSTLGAGRQATYVLDWKWDFEGDDEYDTLLGNLAADGEELFLTIVIETVATQCSDPDNSSGDLPPTGDDNSTFVWLLAAILAFAGIYIVLMAKKRHPIDDQL